MSNIVRFYPPPGYIPQGGGNRNRLAIQAAQLAGSIVAAGGYNMYKSYSSRGGRNLRGYSRRANPRSTIIRARNAKFPSSRKPKTLSAKVNALTKQVNSDLGKHTYRSSAASRLISTDNNVIYKNFALNDADLCQTSMANLRFYNPSVPGTLTTADFSTGTFSRKVHLTNYGSLQMRNNYQIPVTVTAYVCVPRDDTSIGTKVAFEQSCTDQGNPSSTSINMYPTDGDQFNELWRVAKTHKRTLQPGQEMNVSKGSGKFDFDPAVYDQHALTYQKQWKACQVLLRVEGPLAHDSSVTGEQGISQAGVDVKLDIKYVITYDAGIKLNDFTVDDSGLDSFTNSAVVSNKPTSNNQSYEVS